MKNAHITISYSQDTRKYSCANRMHCSIFSPLLATFSTVFLSFTVCVYYFFFSAHLFCSGHSRASQANPMFTASVVITTFMRKKYEIRRLLEEIVITQNRWMQKQCVVHGTYHPYASAHCTLHTTHTCIRCLSSSKQTLAMLLI